MNRNRAFIILIPLAVFGFWISYSFDYSCDPVDVETMYDISDNIYIANIKWERVMSENIDNNIKTTKSEYDIEVLKNLKWNKKSWLYISSYRSEHWFYDERSLRKWGIYLIYWESFHGLCPTNARIAELNDYKHLDIYKYIKRSDSVLYNLSIKFQLWIQSQINQVEQHDNLSIKKKLYWLFLACEKLLSDECWIVSKECVLQNDECRKRKIKHTNEDSQKEWWFVPAEKID